MRMDVFVLICLLGAAAFSGVSAQISQGTKHLQSPPPICNGFFFQDPCMLNIIETPKDLFPFQKAKLAKFFKILHNSK